jgi:hypothetical protein
VKKKGALTKMKHGASFGSARATMDQLTQDYSKLE